MKKNYYDCLSDFYKRITNITPGEFNYLSTLPIYFGNYKKCYETFIVNFHEVCEIDNFEYFRKKKDIILNFNFLGKKKILKV